MVKSNDEVNQVLDTKVEESDVTEKMEMEGEDKEEPGKNPDLKAAAEKNDKEYNIMNESFVRMQKIAGIIK